MPRPPPRPRCAGAPSSGRPPSPPPALDARVAQRLGEGDSAPVERKHAPFDLGAASPLGPALVRLHPRPPDAPTTTACGDYQFLDGHVAPRRRRRRRGDFLGAFQIPPGDQRQLLSMLATGRPRKSDAAEQRRRIEARLERLGERYELGAITRERYLAQRQALQEEPLASPRRLMGATTWPYGGSPSTCRMWPRPGEMRSPSSVTASPARCSRTCGSWITAWWPSIRDRSYDRSLQAPMRRKTRPRPVC